MTDHTALVLLAAALTALTAALIACAAGYLARGDHTTWPHTITRAATAFAATLTLAAMLATTLHILTHWRGNRHRTADADQGCGSGRRATHPDQLRPIPGSRACTKPPMPAANACGW